MELLLAIAIFVILVGMVLARFPRNVLQGTQATSRLNHIGMTLRLAEELAKTEGNDFRVHFTFSGATNKYSNYEIDQYDASAATYNLYRSETYSIKGSENCTSFGTGADRLQDVEFFALGGCRALNPSGTDIADPSFHGLRCSGGARNGSITVYLSTCRIQLSVN